MSHAEIKEVVYINDHRIKVDGLYYRMEQACIYEHDHMGVAGNWFSKCSECGAEFDERVVDRHFVYCPECGARVVGTDDR